MAKEYLNRDQFHWIFQDSLAWCDDDTYTYKFECEWMVTDSDAWIGHKAVTAVTKLKTEDADIPNLGCSPENFVDLGDTWTDYDSEFYAIWRMMNYRASKTNRTRQDFWATQKWLQKLPVGERVEL